MGRRRRRQRGDAIVEFALLVPTLVLILFGVLELGRVVDAWLVVHNAAREGARAGALVYPDPTTAARTAASTYLTSALGSRTDVAALPTPAVTYTSDTVQVTAEADVQLYTPLFQALLSTSTVQVRASTSMRRQ